MSYFLQTKPETDSFKNQYYKKQLTIKLIKLSKL